MGLTEFVAGLGEQIIRAIGYPGVFLLMTAESMILPVPSEAVMPFAGFLVAEGTLTLPGVILAATLGSVVGSLLSYGIGLLGGLPFLTRYGKYLLLDREALDTATRFFQKRGGLTILVTRFIPVVRHVISIPAGVARMPLLPFVLLTAIGAGAWNTILTLLGITLKRNWPVIMRYSHVVDIVVVAILAIGLVLWVVLRLGKMRRARAAE